MQANRFNPVAGFLDYFGNDVRLHDYIIAVLSNYLYTCSFDKIRVPTLEQQTFFSSEFVGRSPWPAWHPKSLFTVRAKSFLNSYEETHAPENFFFLVPEATTSVCRWLASEISSGELKPPFNEALKVFYTTTCFRNELESKLSPTKHKEFLQIGAEIFGALSHNADKEILDIVVRSLERLGLPRKNIRLRLSDVRLFNYMCDISHLSEIESSMLKDMLDEIASLRAKDKRELLESCILKFKEKLLTLNLDKDILEKWELFYGGYISSKDNIGVLQFLPQEIIKNLQDLLVFSHKSDFNVVIDLSVIRGQEYYSGLTFQFDVLDHGNIITEVVGGGRYDYFMNKLLSTNVENGPIVPATGFAYSLERIVMALKVNKKTLDNDIVTINLGQTIEKEIDMKIGDVDACDLAEKLRLEGKIIRLNI